MESKKTKIISSPKSVSIAITGKCNLKCKYCFYANEMQVLKDLSTETWKKFFSELKDIGVMDVTLTGGEAFTRPDIFELIDSVIKNRMRYNILSNGTLITEKLISEFDKGKRKVRLNSIQISIDGSSAEIHDKSRPNSFKRAIRGLKLLKRAAFPLNVRVTISKHNLYDLKNIAELLLDEIGVGSFSTNEAMPIGAGCQNAESVSLSPEDQLYAMNKLDELLKIYPGRITGSAGPIFKKKMYSEMAESKKTGKKSGSFGMGFLTACGCVYSRLDILHDGTIIPCHMLTDLKLGDIQTDSLQDIWLNHPIMEAMRSRIKIPLKEVKGCEKCEWNAYCNGGCPGIAFQMTGDFNRANPEDCFRDFLKGIGGKYAK